ncbi:MAG TPA: hypothetical protein VGX25_35380 [Actinophytocola sp.]|uniref:hypothetical protein n=1 Tax=Actinophytocola sp. TaxID=1872138 RepID=UPI002DDD6043|nr:hypothetical protein [Actinophytocola sp.]HEV2784697.1 hypothetical protein [Actinophytocola sp.]
MSEVGVGYLTADVLVKPSLTEDDHTIDGKGTIRIRAMSREEMYELRKKARIKKDSDEIDNARYERLVVVACVVQPELDVNQALEWQRGSDAGELSGVVDAILDLSKLKDGASKSDLLGDGDDA